MTNKNYNDLIEDIIALEREIAGVQERVDYGRRHYSRDPEIKHELDIMQIYIDETKQTLTDARKYIVAMRDISEK